MKEAVWGSSSAPDPHTMESLVKLCTLRPYESTEVILYWDPLEECVWRADIVHGRVSWQVTNV